MGVWGERPQSGFFSTNDYFLLKFSGTRSQLNFDFHAPPERNISFNIFSCIFSCRVVPSCILVNLSIYPNTVVAGHPLPGTGRMSAALLKILLVDGVEGEVLVSFNNFALIALSEYCTIPDCFWHRYFN